MQKTCQLCLCCSVSIVMMQVRFQCKLSSGLRTSQDVPQRTSVSQTVLTWPKKRKGRRNVSPFHIQDWNPSKNRKQAKVKSTFSLPRLFTRSDDAEPQMCPMEHQWFQEFAICEVNIYVWLRHSQFCVLGSAAHPRSGPCCVSLPELAVCTSSHSDNSTAGTEQNLCLYKRHTRRGLVWFVKVWTKTEYQVH